MFRRVMDCLGVEVIAHMPRGSDGRRTTARSKGKVERPFRTVKEAHETLYHFHQPQTEAQANVWLANFVAKCNQRDHRSEDHSRQDDWLTHLPADGLRAMCAWERFCSFAREPERRTVGIDCRLTVAGVTYELDAELAGEDVIVWWGLFDQELFAERGDDRFGPFQPLGGPIPLHRYRKHRKSLRDSLDKEDRIIVSRALTLDKAKITVPLLLAALFYDLSTEKTVSISSQSERRERDLVELFRKVKKPVALFVDDAHDLHPKTLMALKRLLELVVDGGGQLAIVLIGHPKLKNDLRRPKMEEVGDRTTVFEFGGLRDRQRDLHRLGDEELARRGRARGVGADRRGGHDPGGPAQDPAADRAAPGARLRGGLRSRGEADRRGHRRDGAVTPHRRSGAGADAPRL